MGLDISAYSGLKLLDVVYDRSGEPIDPTTRKKIQSYVSLIANQDFPGRESPFEDGEYSYVTQENVYYSSYGGYGIFRNDLAKYAGYPEAYDRSYPHFYVVGCWNAGSGPFYELICFSDCEGVIGTTVATKLLKDFETFDDQVRKLSNEPFYKKYCGLTDGLRIATDQGILLFH